MEMRLKEIPIEAVESTTEEADMYDVEVEDNHNFFLGNGILTHNSINLLKSATETDEVRLLTKSNYSKAQDDLPSRFEFKGKIIFDYNQVEGLALKEDFDALKTRGDFVDVAFCIEDIKRIMTLICNEDWKKEVTAHLIKHYEFNGQNILNLRTQWKAFKTYEYAKEHNIDWKHELQQELKTMISPVRGNLYSLIGNKAVRTSELKKLMLRNNMIGTMRTADTRINDWILMEELFKCSAEEKNFYVSIDPIDSIKANIQKEI